MSFSLHLNLNKIFIVISLISNLILSIGYGQVNGPDEFNNPILSGFHPDPSIVRVDDDYYLVNSSFNWFPGIPIFHSKDLVNWEQIGHVLSRPEQLNMETPGNAGGIWAPTIRYHKGIFYVIVTCKQCINTCNCGDNFYVTSTNPAGPWSDPVWVDKSFGIDPTLFWDDDGKVYYIGSTHELEGGREWPSQDKIFISEIDLQTGKIISEPVVLTAGHASNAKFAEGPHIYKKDGKYILLISEGGTWNNHAVTTFYSDNITGPYIPNQINPAITHRHLGENIEITTIGHADLVETQNGEWWAVMLGCRPIDGKYYLGRETFLTKVEWQGTAPIFNPGIGKVLSKDLRPNLPWSPVKHSFRDNFDGDGLNLKWNMLRTPQQKWFQLKNEKLYLQLRPQVITQKSNPSLLAQRLRFLKSSASTQLHFNTKKDNETAGLIVMQNTNYNYQLLKTNKGIELIKVFNEDRKKLSVERIAYQPYDHDSVILKMENDGMVLRFYFGIDENNLERLGEDQDAEVITSNIAGGFIGAYVGMYASSNGKLSNNKASYDWFEYKPL